MRRARLTREGTVAISHRICAAWLASFLLAGLMPAQSGAGSEYQIKAAFLINFARFVDWPEAGGASDPFILCVVGRDPFGAILDDTASGKTVNGRTLVIRRVATIPEVRPCQMAFLPASDMYRFDEMAASLKDRPVLTVGEAKAFALRGGHINFVMQGDRVHFEINPSAAALAHLRISSRLLLLATIVGGGLPGG
jgi:hypothetical protein